MPNWTCSDNDYENLNVSPDFNACLILSLSVVIRLVVYKYNRF